MNYIVFDLELTCWEGDMAGRFQEIIEIGAYKIDPYGHIQSQFSKFVKPVMYPILSPFCSKLTSITQEMITQAKPFKQVIKEFMDWAEIDIEPHYLIAWGDKDLDYLKADCLLHKIDTEWISSYTDLKKQYQKVKKLYEPKGLKHATESEGLEFEGTLHRAIDDAYNLTRIFTKYFGEWNLHKIN
ncbi:MAG: exonuclease domain-containing protein [Saprospiraceae bacterium]|jgi:inhibitor of KinA sporulation pathway (predicted exonuclease)|nr:exonuclease domain-containing protein [Saprospiraceae bacterium]MBK6481505.1 exonuclease domain-containing protein [Saprospiraceae bacterium]MBK6815973.1 exonuclease domain-containing protein [Saprospiraceae bacterium]MBK7370572.1 exonuclease domain-containing protein [Saprospiraceae bacterium]MBK7438722.1 exonuclease domain-containing protein [Saprospiraceae bacterium]